HRIFPSPGRDVERSNTGKQSQSAAYVRSSAVPGPPYQPVLVRRSHRICGELRPISGWQTIESAFDPCGGFSYRDCGVSVPLLIEPRPRQEEVPFLCQGGACPGTGQRTALLTSRSVSSTSTVRQLACLPRSCAARYVE